MSATNRGSVRNEADFYPTPGWCVRRLLEACPLPGGNWLEPAAGDGAIIKAVNAVRPDVRWSALDIRAEVAPQIAQTGASFIGADFLTTADAIGSARFDVLITNPPFSLAQEFIERSLRVADCVAMLLRLNYLGGAKRCEFMRANPPSVYVLPNRPSFTGHGTDATEYAWFVWNPPTFGGNGRIQVLPLTPAEERKTA
jgi:hypothetical protein